MPTTVFQGTQYGCVWNAQCQKTWGFDAAPQTPIPLHQICQQQCFWIPSMGVFGMHNAKIMGFCRGAPNTLRTKYASNSVSGYLVRVVKMHNAKKHEVLTRRPKHPYICTKYASNSVSGYLVRVCLKCTMPKSVQFWGGAPNAHTSSPNMSPAVFLDT